MSQSIEVELNELRSLIAKSASVAPPKVVKELEARLKALETRVAAGVDPGEATRSAIMQALSTANGGKPGMLSHAQIQELCNITKSASHAHVNELEKKGKVWVRKTHDPQTGRPLFLVYHPSAVRV